MAYDEILRARWQKQLEAEQARLVSLRLVVEPNVDHDPRYWSNAPREFWSWEPVDALYNMLPYPDLTWCSNPKCVGAQIDVSALYRACLTPEGGTVAFSEKVKCLGTERRRRLSRFSRFLRNFRLGGIPSTLVENGGYVIDPEFNNWKGNERVPSFPKCDNIIGVSGEFVFRAEVATN